MVNEFAGRLRGSGGRQWPVNCGQGSAGLGVKVVPRIKPRPNACSAQPDRGVFGRPWLLCPAPKGREHMLTRPVHTHGDSDSQAGIPR